MTVNGTNERHRQTPRGGGETAPSNEMEGKTVAEKFINTGKVVRLATLIKSGEVDDKTWICIYDKNGKFLLCGTWYEDKVLEYSELFGKATKRPSGFSVNHRVMFRLI